MAGIAELLPAAVGRPRRPRLGTVFKIERGPAGEKIAYVRMFSGTIRTRDRLRFGRELEDKVTAIAVFERGPAAQRPSVSGRRDRKALGSRRDPDRRPDRRGRQPTASARSFAPPTLESVVVAARPGRTRAAPRRARAARRAGPADQRPAGRHPPGDLRLALRRGPEGGDPGDAGKRVRPRGHLPRDDADLHRAADRSRRGCRGPPRGIESVPRHDRAAHRAGARRLRHRVPADVDPRTVPLFIYKTRESFTEHMDEYVRETLREGLFGWQVTDCVVTMTECAYSVPDGPPSRRGPLSTAADFRKLTPLVAHAGARAGRAGRLRADRPRRPRDPDGHDRRRHGRARRGSVLPSRHRRCGGSSRAIEAVLPAARAQDLQRQLPGLTGGEGVLDSTFAGYEPVAGDQPTRRVLIGGFG